MYFGTACEEEAWLIAYVDEAIAGMKTNLYSYLCHPDLFMYRRVFDEVAKARIDTSVSGCKGITYTTGIQSGRCCYNDIMHTMQYPYIDFWKTAAEVGNTAIIGVGMS